MSRGRPLEKNPLHLCYTCRKPLKNVSATKLVIERPGRVYCSADCFCIFVNKEEERKELGIISEEEFE